MSQKHGQQIRKCRMCALSILSACFMQELGWYHGIQTSSLWDGVFLCPESMDMNKEGDKQ